MTLTNKPADPEQAAAQDAQRQEIREAGEFSLNDFIAGFRAPRFEAPVHMRPDLYPKIVALQEQLAELQQDRSDDADAKPRATYADAHPGRALQEQLDLLIDEYEASARVFTFRMIGSQDVNAALQAAKEADQEDMSDCYGMAAAVVSPSWSAEDFMGLFRFLPTAAWIDLRNVFSEALGAGNMVTGLATAPFSRRSSPGPTT